MFLLKKTLPYFSGPDESKEIMGFYILKIKSQNHSKNKKKTK
jgi:hypothetical protein